MTPEQALLKRCLEYLRGSPWHQASTAEEQEGVALWEALEAWDGEPTQEPPSDG